MAGGRDQLAEALSAHERRLFAYFRRMGVDHHSAADLSQETFLRALRGVATYRADAAVELWLLGIARNVFLSWLRREVRRRERLADSPQTRAEPPVVGPSAEEAIDIERALARLDVEHREVLVLRCVLELPGEAVADLLGISHEAVRQRLGRAKTAFRQRWELSNDRA